MEKNPQYLIASEILEVLKIHFDSNRDCKQPRIQMSSLLKKKAIQKYQDLSFEFPECLKITEA